eukprot:TRINITY_DN12929_c0_g1_i1.p1 TRINITY_DN12929_c0_g1~~TRINITY_DN12929_c0_g1_i1.p1  ORF type:complete len:753 (+),score=113.20 TRINITY_DN12929_c0_g1_i1:146-2404(+)
MVTGWVAVIVGILAMCAFAKSELSPSQKAFLEVPDAAEAKKNLLALTSKPHLAGTEEDYETALFMKAKFEEFGFDTHIDTFSTTSTYPIHRHVAITDPPSARFVCTLEEGNIAQDNTSTTPNQVPTFNGYSASGNVTAELVYANYGLSKDFEYLESIGVNVSEKIVIVRYGENFRGCKVMLAQQRGAIGVLIYTDPQDTGYTRGAIYPSGPWSPSTAVQRGSVQFSPVCPCDSDQDYFDAECKTPTTPISSPVPSIPVQPLSWADAQPLLTSIAGPAAPTGWIGALPIIYSIGPGPAIVNIDLTINVTTTDVWNVIAEIPGIKMEDFSDADNIVLLGNHRDAWVFGAGDPNSGTAALLEVARGFAALRDDLGWTPKRTIRLCSWDAEEHALQGSVKYTEANMEELAKNAVAYLNVDIAVVGQTFRTAATQSLNTFLRDIASEIEYPSTGLNESMTLLQHWEVTNDADVELLGAGSDFVAFVHRLGIASSDFGFAGDYGVYHSKFDSYSWMEQFGDPTFEFHVAAAQFYGLQALALADAIVLPFEYVPYASALQDYFVIMAQSVENSGGNSSELELEALKNELDRFEDVAYDLQQIKSNLSDRIASDGEDALREEIHQLNEVLFLAERRLLMPEGLPQRKWFKHAIAAPGIYSGYAADAFPGIAQAIREKDWPVVTSQTLALAERINALSNFIETGGISSDENDDDDDVETILIIILGSCLGATGIILAIVFVIVFVVFRRRRLEYETLGSEG